MSPSDFASLDQVGDRLSTFECRYNKTARPIEWELTQTDLEGLPARIERHTQNEHYRQPSGHNHQPAAQSPAA